MGPSNSAAALGVSADLVSIVARYQWLQEVASGRSLLDATSAASRRPELVAVASDPMIDDWSSPQQDLSCRAEFFQLVTCLDLPIDRREVRLVVQRLAPLVSSDGLLVLGFGGIDGPIDEDEAETLLGDLAKRFPSGGALVERECRVVVVQPLGADDDVTLGEAGASGKLPPTGYLFISGSGLEPPRPLAVSPGSGHTVQTGADALEAHSRDQLLARLQEAELLLERLPQAEVAIREVQWYRDRLDSVAESASWRVTAPLRRSSAYFRLRTEALMDRVMDTGGDQIIRKAIEAVGSRFRR
jgi:hypothetical protein